jgi:hypothetical protein
MLRPLVLLLFGVATVASAQQPTEPVRRMSGVVRDAGSGVALAGAVVMVLDSLHQVSRRTLSSDSGRYGVELVPGAVQMRVVRIGYRPQTLALSARSAGNVVMDVAMTKLATLLSAVQVNDDRLCSPDTDRASALSLWEQARAGLLASVVARDEHPALTTVFRYKRLVDARSGGTLGWKGTDSTFASSRPFIAAFTPSRLAELGYADDTERQRQYLAPDADVLLDESFAATHCIGVRQADAGHAGAIGIVFEPVRGRDEIVDVRGTLWLEAEVPALRALEFTYVGTPTGFRDGDGSGKIHFRTVRNGVTFVDEWTLRLPQYGALPTGMYGSPRGRHLARFDETGGLVRRISWLDGTEWHSPAWQLDAIVTERESAAPLPGAIIAVDDRNDTFVADSAGRATLFPVWPGVHTVTAKDTVLAKLAPSSSVSQELTTRDGEPATVHLELPSRVSAFRDWCGGTLVSADSVILAGELLVQGSSVSEMREMSAVATWAGADTSARERRVSRVDGLGYFAVCAVPRSATVRLQIGAAEKIVVDRTLRVGGHATVHFLRLRVLTQPASR